MPKRKVFLPVAVIILLILILSGKYIYSIYFGNASCRNDLKRFSQGSYDSILLSMHSSSGYTPENFMTYGAHNILISSCEIQTADELQRYMETSFSSDNAIGNVYLMLDPHMIWNSCGQNETQWDEALQKSLFSFASEYSETKFSIMLPYPSLSYWLNMDEASLNEILDVYHSFIEEAYNYTNILTFYMGFENWLLINPDNYVSDFDVNDIIAKKIYLTCFCDKVNQITPINDQILFDMLREQVAAERTSPTAYPDLSDCCLVFFGDSIMAYGEGTVTTPGYITGFSRASTYNYAVGGTTASAVRTDTDDFPNILPRFLAKYCTQENGIYSFSPEGKDMSGKKLYFLFTYGANDYFNGIAIENPEDPYDISTYKGSLRTCLGKLMADFPDAEFILMAPGFTSYYSNGTERNSDVGGALTDYVDAAVSISEELDIHCIDNYHDLGINESNVSDYTADGCHPNEKLRILMAEKIINYIDSL